MPQRSILIVEDDPEMTAVLRQGFEQGGMSVQVAADGREAMDSARRRKFQAIVLDLMLPVMDGFSVAQELRAGGDGTPILMLTARDTVADIVHALDCGVDDYLTKPFSFIELSARVRALIRRAAPPAAAYQEGGLTMDVSGRRVLRAGTEIHLSKSEFQLLEVLMRNRGRVVRRTELLRSVWGSVSVEENTLDVLMKSLRTRIECPGHPRLIHTVRGFGYRLSSSE